MKPHIAIATLFVAASSLCIVKADDSRLFLNSKFYDEIHREVRKSDGQIRRSLPELRFVKNRLLPSVRTVELSSAEAKGFQVLILDAPSRNWPGEDFALAYLKNAKGEIVDWRSKWLSVREGQLETRLRDVNDNGTKEFCFVSKRLDSSEQLLSAYAVKEQKFDPVIAEDHTSFNVAFSQTTSAKGLVLTPQLKGNYIWETDKFYEIPVRVVNKSNEDCSVKNCYVWFASEIYGGGTGGDFDVETIKSKNETNVNVVVRFTQIPPPGKLGFEIKTTPELP